MKNSNTKSSTTKPNSKENKKKNPKKTDGDDEESKGFVEKELEKDNLQKIDVLEKNVSMIKSITKGITG